MKIHDQLNDDVTELTIETHGYDYVRINVFRDTNRFYDFGQYANQCGMPSERSNVIIDRAERGDWLFVVTIDNETTVDYIPGIVSNNRVSVMSTIVDTDAVNPFTFYHYPGELTPIDTDAITDAVVCTIARDAYQRRGLLDLRRARQSRDYPTRQSCAG